MHINKVAAIFLLWGIFDVASDAVAATTAVTYTGTVTYDSEANAFGVSGPETFNIFTGDSVRMTFTENLANGFQTDYFPYYFGRVGGTGYADVPSPIISSTFTVSNGPSLSVAGYYIGQQYNESPSYTGIGQQFTLSADYNDSTTYYASIFAEVEGPLVPEFGSYSGANDGTFEAEILTGTGLSTWNLSQGYIEGTVNSVFPGVPEPSTWAMILLGFIGLGFVPHRRTIRKDGAVPLSAI